MTNIGIIGAGVAGLHLALLLQKHGVNATLYTDKTADEQERSSLRNTVVHHHHTRARERALGVNYWDSPDYGSFCHHHYISAPGGGPWLSFQGDFKQPSLCVDYRIYLPRLLRTFEARGGRVVMRAVTESGLEELSSEHDLMVVATGRHGLSDLFPRDAARSPFDRPQRLLCAGLWSGVALPDPVGVTLSVAPGQGELISIPTISFNGPTTALLFEAIPGGEMEPLAHLRYASGAKEFERAVLDVLAKHHPSVYQQVDPKEFGLLRPTDLLQGAVTPCVRRSYISLSTGVFAVAVGDSRVSVDPMTGQGANLASYTAWTLGEMILGGAPPGRDLCEELERRTAEFILGTSSWTNIMLTTPPRLIDLFKAMAENRSIADEVTEYFNYPHLLGDILATPESTAAYLRERGASVAGTSSGSNRS
jgi:2-polyprenyl-6-methoxyphenol hydroxylase-like FAD-dependent oxidoreductase